jgi:hypothetical protein
LCQTSQGAAITYGVFLQLGEQRDDGASGIIHEESHFDGFTRNGGTLEMTQLQESASQEQERDRWMDVWDIRVRAGRQTAVPLPIGEEIHRSELDIGRGPFGPHCLKLTQESCRNMSCDAAGPPEQ